VSVSDPDSGVSTSGEFVVTATPPRTYQAQVIEGRLTGTLGSMVTGTHTVTARARDVAGNWAEKVFTINIDVTVPSPVSLLRPAAWTRTTSVVMSGSASDGQSGMDARRIGTDLAVAPWIEMPNGPYTSTISLPGSDGRKTVYGEFRDKIGLVAARSTTIDLDTRGPIITPVSPAPDSTVSIVGLQVKGTWADDTTVTPYVSGVVETDVQIFWYDGATGQTTDVTSDPKMDITDTGFTFTPIVVPNGVAYNIFVNKADRVGNWASTDWGFWTA
jgi:hypothetical protein